MQFPYLEEIPASRQTVDVFKGYNHNLRIGDGEFFDMTNMTSDHYPVLSPRGRRSVYTDGGSYYGMIAKDHLCYVDGVQFFINHKPVDGLLLSDDTDYMPKQLVSMGAYVIILPDKKWVNTKDLSFGDIEAEYYPGEGKKVQATFEMCKLDGRAYGNAEKSDTAPEDPVDQKLWIDTSTVPHSLKQYSKDTGVWTAFATTYIKIKAPGIGRDFQQYDGVQISGFPEKLKDMNDGSYVLWEVHHDEADPNNDYVVIIGFLDTAIENANVALKITRRMPKMDFIIESGNRLWGCYYGLTEDKTKVVNEIYASKLGDFKNWECFQGISTDSYAASVGTDGQWTGAITHLGYPLFFKENHLHKVYGNYPANYQIQVTECNGVEKDSGKSLAIVGTTLFYKGRSGVYAYDGSLPVSMSYPLGNEAYSDAVGGSVGNKYYISMEERVTGDKKLFVFDVANSLWHKEDEDYGISKFCTVDGILYAIVDGNCIVDMLGSRQNPNKPMDAVEWMVETGQIGVADPDTQTLQKIHLRMQMEIGSEVIISVQYDCEDAWHQVGYVMGDCLQSFLLPIRPRRCQFLRLKLEGKGDVKVYSMTKTISGGSDKA